MNTIINYIIASFEKRARGSGARPDQSGCEALHGGICEKNQVRVPVGQLSSAREVRPA